MTSFRIHVRDVRRETLEGVDRMPLAEGHRRYSCEETPAGVEPGFCRFAGGGRTVRVSVVRRIEARRADGVRADSVNR